MVGWGEGLEQAAAYLNGLPNAENLYVVTSYNHVVRPRFVGTTIPIAPYMQAAERRALPEPGLHRPLRERRAASDRSRRRSARAEAIGQPVFVAEINGLPYAWVYSIPRVGPRPAAAAGRGGL